MTDTNSWNNSLVAAFKIKMIWYVHFILNIIWFTWSQKSQIICQREFFMKCLRSVEGILNLTLIISNSSAEFAALSTSLFPCMPVWPKNLTSLTTLIWFPYKCKQGSLWGLRLVQKWTQAIFFGNLKPFSLAQFWILWRQSRNCRSTEVMFLDL